MDNAMERDKKDLLSSIRFFSSLTESEFDQISPRVALKDFRKGEVILNEEDSSDFMYMVLEGKVKVFRNTEDGKETILAFHGTGQFFGEMSLIDGKTAPATVSATEDSLVATVSRKDFYALIFNQGKILEELLQILCSRIRDSWKLIEMLNFKNASERLRMLFLILSDENGRRTPEGIVLDIKLTHQNIADMTGLTRETVTRVLDRWQRSGEITISRDRQILLTGDFLKKIPAM
jgi:CRP/FNR family transcriptional regulator